MTGECGADNLVTPKGVIKVDNPLGEYYSNIPLAHTHIPNIQTPEVYFFSVLWDSHAVPGQQLLSSMTMISLLDAFFLFALVSSQHCQLRLLDARPSGQS